MNINTKVTFYCTHLQYGSFEKLIFEAIYPVDLRTLHEIDEYIMLGVADICDEFDLSCVFDWVIISFRDSTSDTYTPILKNTIPGKLVFKDTYEAIELKADIYDLNKEAEGYKTISKNAQAEVDKLNKAQKELKRRDYQSVWIDPFGETYKVGFAGHNDFAIHWLKEHDPKTYHDVHNSYSYHYEALEERGWARILGWSDPPSFQLPDVMSKQMVLSLREYCISQNVPYEAFPDILKH